jgi:hypothetical protein
LNWGADTAAIMSTTGVGTCGQGYYIHRPTRTTGPTCSYRGVAWETWFNGRYHAPEIWDDRSKAEAQLFSRELPGWNIRNSSNTVHIRYLRLDHDWDNDGWIDKYDDDFMDPTEH